MRPRIRSFVAAPGARRPERGRTDRGRAEETLDPAARGNNMRGVGAEVTDRGEHAMRVPGVPPGGPPDPPVRRGPLRTTDREDLPMAELARLRALEERHAALEMRIAEEDNRPRPDADQLSRMKREKLRLKEEMERLRGHRVH
ncbi:hypothetical protein DFH01_22745 [Falsiroseomonas bella]|uniref:DUF465 domain-containing protein n=2 Tax=Falsiroseomonas bella TaxID=2184016 RepID=A0A317F7V7_9PROT|nr:hypothetical protein DFH01_22745 [Falsiroseomonas bella]